MRPHDAPTTYVQPADLKFRTVRYELEISIPRRALAPTPTEIERGRFGEIHSIRARRVRNGG